MKYTIAKVIDSEYEDTYLAAVDVFGPFKRLPRKIRGIIFNQINKINHPCICGIINRHIMPEPTGPWGLDVFGPRKCLRCGEIRSVMPLISSTLWAVLNTEVDAFSKWACRMYK